MLLSIEKTFQILEELKKQPKDEIELAIYTLLADGTIDYVTLSKLYVEKLETDNHDKNDMLMEAEQCALEHLCIYKKENKTNHNAIHRTLYLLNKSNRFQMNRLNERFNYNEEEDKKLSWYEKYRNGK